MMMVLGWIEILIVVVVAILAVRAWKSYAGDVRVGWLLVCGAIPCLLLAMIMVYLLSAHSAAPTSTRAAVSDLSPAVVEMLRSSQLTDPSRGPRTDEQRMEFEDVSSQQVATHAEARAIQARPTALALILVAVLAFALVAVAWSWYRNVSDNKVPWLFLCCAIPCLLLAALWFVAVDSVTVVTPQGVESEYVVQDARKRLPPEVFEKLLKQMEAAAAEVGSPSIEVPPGSATSDSEVDPLTADAAAETTTPETASETAPEEVTPAIGSTVIAKTPLPEWVSQPVVEKDGTRVVVVSSGQYTTEEEAGKQAMAAAVERVTHDVWVRYPEMTGSQRATSDLVANYILQRTVETQIRDFGAIQAPMYRVHLQVGISPELAVHLQKKWQDALIQQRVQVLLGGVGVATILLAGASAGLRRKPRAARPPVDVPPQTV